MSQQSSLSDHPGDQPPHGDGRESSASAPDPAQGSLLTTPLLAITRLVLRFPIFTLALAIGLSVAGAIYAFMYLGYKTNRLDLLNPKSDHNRLWIEYVKEFGDEDDAVIVVEGAGRDQVVPVLEELSTALGREKRLFHAVLHEVDLSKIRAKGLHYLSAEQLQGINQYLDEAVPIINGDWSRLQVGKLVGGSAQMLQAAISGAHAVDPNFAFEHLDRAVNSLAAQFGAQPHYLSPLPSMPDELSILSELGTEFFLAKEGRIGFVLLRIAVAKDELARGSEAVRSLRELIGNAELRHPGVKIGLTGLPIMENDEMESSQSSMLRGSILSLFGVVIVVIAGFGGVRHALLANLVLLIGTGWAFGYATFAVGHLNILSITFTATLIGVGIDYGTYYVSRYLQYRREGKNCEESLLTTSRIAGPAILTGAMTTVVAFFATGTTSFTGIAELGIIAGGGILLCAIAQLFVLPALVRVVDESRIGDRLPKPVPVHAGIRVLMKAPRLIMMLAVITTVTAGWGANRLWYDYNLLNMQPEGQESVELEKKLLSECDQSAWYALSYSDSREELLKRKAKFLTLPSVDRTQEIASMLTSDDEVKQPIIATIARRLASLPERPPLIAVDTLDDLGAIFAQAQELAQHSKDGANTARHLELLRDAMRRLPASDCYAKLSQFQQQMAGDLLSRLHILRSVANPEPPQLSDLSASLVSRFVGQNGKFLLKIYGRGDIWNMDVLTKFVHDIRSVDPQATGNPLQTYECSLEMIRSYKWATFLSVIVIFGVLYIDFRNFKHCAMAAIPQFMGIAVTFGLLGYMNTPLNAANLIAIPIILGIGVDYSVYIVHEFLEQKGRYRMSPGTAVAVMVDSLTTLIGYGSLLIASHRGLHSLGQVLTIAVTFCTLMSVIALPAFLTWITRKRPLVPWVGDAVISYDHNDLIEMEADSGNLTDTRRAA
ncbi:MAG TPA: MMPL family transporter [Pirellulales bacterium]